MGPYNMTVQNVFEHLGIPFKSMLDKYIDVEPLGWVDRDDELIEFNIGDIQTDNDGHILIIFEEPLLVEEKV